MKYVIGVLALLLAMGVASADVQIWGNAYLLGTGTGPSGQIFGQTVQNGGQNWQEYGDVAGGGWYIPPSNPTAVDMIFTNQVANTGLTQIGKYIDFNGDWNVAGLDSMLLTPAPGTTGTIWKGLGFDTNTMAVVATGSNILEKPTHMIAADTLNFDTVNAYQQTIDATLNIKPAQTWNTDNFISTFTSPLTVNEMFAKNMPKPTLITAPLIPKPIDP